MARIRPHARHQDGEHRNLQRAAHYRPFDKRRVPISAGGAAGTKPGRARQRDAGARRRRQSKPGPDERFLDIHGEQSLDLSRNRPRKGAGARPDIGEVFTTLEATLGGVYVNDFNLYGRTWQVNIEGVPADRRDVIPVEHLHQEQHKPMVPLRSIASVRPSRGPR